MEEIKKKKDGRGGPRPGSGRPKGDSKLYAFRCPGPLAAKIDSQPNKTEFIRDSLNAAILRRESAKKFGEVIPAANLSTIRLPFFDQRVVAGFPVPLDNDERSQDIDILSMLVPHPEASYLIRVQGDSMIDADIMSGDIVIVDKSNRTPSSKEIAVCELNGEYTLKRIAYEDGQAWLVPANPNYPKFRVTPDDEFSIWGTVTYIIHKARD